MTPLQTIRLHEAAIRRLAAQFSVQTGGAADREDLLQDGFVALLEMQFDENQPTRQRHGYVEQRMRGAMLDSLRRSDPCPRSVRKTLRVIADASRQLTAQLGRSPTDAEIAAAAGLSLSAYFAARHAAYVAALGPPRADEIEDNTEVDEVFAAQYGAQSFRSPLDSAALDEIRQHVAAAVDALPPRLRHILVSRLLQERTQAELAAELGVTVSRVSQLQKEAITRLRAALEDSTARVSHR
jgi:RNA polymerase sigma factor FliA